MTDNKKYKLLKDTFNAMAGTEFIQLDAIYEFMYEYRCNNGSYARTRKEFVENNPAFFELIPIPSKEVQERIVVEFIEMNSDYCGKPSHSFTTTHEINEFPTIKQAIEADLNEDTVVEDGFKVIEVLAYLKGYLLKNLNYEGAAKVRDIEKQYMDLSAPENQPKEQQDNTKPFVWEWTDELVSDFIMQECNKYNTWDEDGIKKWFVKFKKENSRSPASTSGEWEIIKVRNLTIDHLKEFDYTPMHTFNWTLWEIYKVKRLSDSAVFTIGDNASTDMEKSFEIKGFEIDQHDKSKMYVLREVVLTQPKGQKRNWRHCCIKDLHSPQPTPLSIHTDTLEAESKAFYAARETKPKEYYVEGLTGTYPNKYQTFADYKEQTKR